MEPILKLLETQASFNSMFQIGIDVIMLGMLAVILVVKKPRISKKNEAIMKSFEKIVEETSAVSQGFEINLEKRQELLQQVTAKLDQRVKEAQSLCAKLDSELSFRLSFRTSSLLGTSDDLREQIFETLHGDTVSKARVEQVVKGLEVHPDSAEECAQLFIDSAIAAGLGTSSGDSITLASAENAPPSPEAIPGDGVEGEATGTDREDPEDAKLAAKQVPGETGLDAGKERPAALGNRPGVILNLNVDPSSDPDKLEKQLRLLRQFGII